MSCNILLRIMPPKKKPRIPPGFLQPGGGFSAGSPARLPSASSWGFHLSQLACPRGVPSAATERDVSDTCVVASGSLHGASSSSSAQQLPVSAGIASRSDAPLVKPYGRADRQRALEVASSNELLHDAVITLRRDAVANSARRSRQSLLSTWTTIHNACCPDLPVFPLVPASIERISASLKSGGYRSARNYIARAKDEHLAQGHHWSDLLARASRVAIRSCERGQGPPSRQVPFDLDTAFARSSDVFEPLVPDGPMGFSNLAVLGCFHMLREIELSTTLASSLLIDHDKREEALYLPASKTDHLARGVWRSWGCVCVGLPGPIPCPYHAAASQIEALKVKFAVDGELPHGLPLFPTRDGNAPSKASVVSSLRAWLTSSGISMDCLPTGGHCFRVTGAQMLARAGIDADTIMIAARWTSSAVLKYIREAPLKTLTHRYAALLAGGVRSNQTSDAIAALDERLQQVEARGSSVATYASSHISSSPAASQVDALFVVNTASGVLHRMVTSEAIEPRFWKTLCGWKFAFSCHDRHLVPPCEAVRCARCFESSLAASACSASSSSST